MRINKFVAQSSDLSRRGADEAISSGRVSIDGRQAVLGDTVTEHSTVTLDGRPLRHDSTRTTIMLHKPVGYVCSRNGQGSATIYDLLPQDLHILNPIGRLDKDSSGLLLLTHDGNLANQLSHPRYEKQKVYQVTLNKPLADSDKQRIEKGVMLDDGLSKLDITPAPIAQHPAPNTYEVRMHEGRNRQIRRTFAGVNYKVIALHRTHFGPYALGDLPIGGFKKIVAES